MPVWALLLAVALPITYVLPSGFIYAMTGQGVRLFLFFSSLPPLSLSHCRACTISALLIACTISRIFIARPGGRGDGRWLAGWLVGWLAGSFAPARGVLRSHHFVRVLMFLVFLLPSVGRSEFVRPHSPIPPHHPIQLCPVRP